MVLVSLEKSTFPDNAAVADSCWLRPMILVITVIMIIMAIDRVTMGLFPNFMVRVISANHGDSWTILLMQDLEWSEQTLQELA